jgi:hypothetical protein
MQIRYGTVELPFQYLHNRRQCSKVRSPNAGRATIIVEEAAQWSRHFQGSVNESLGRRAAAIVDLRPDLTQWPYVRNQPLERHINRLFCCLVGTGCMSGCPCHGLLQAAPHLSYNSSPQFLRAFEA